MKYQNAFKRFELKYLLNEEQKQAVLDVMRGRMELDEYGKTSIRNIYYDTPSYLLIRRSLEKPIYKEKLRVRSYGDVDEEGTVFVEIKKKFDGVVYKRRVALPEKVATKWLTDKAEQPVKGQIADEIDYFSNLYDGLMPVCYLSYDRHAYKDLTGHSYRLTMDENVLARFDDLTLLQEPEGVPILEEGMTLMEFKTPGAIPLWLSKCLDENKVQQVSFSKYGKAYRDFIFNANISA